MPSAAPALFTRGCAATLQILKNISIGAEQKRAVVAEIAIQFQSLVQREEFRVFSECFCIYPGSLRVGFASYFLRFPVGFRGQLRQFPVHLAKNRGPLAFPLGPVLGGDTLALGDHSVENTL